MRITRLVRRAAFAIVLVSCAAVAAVPALRTPVLKSAGWALVVEEPGPARADMIVLTVDVGEAGVLEAADLVERGTAPAVAVFADPPSVADREFVRRGIPYEDAAARSIRQLNSLGVTVVDRVPRSVSGTNDEATVLPAWCSERRLQSVVVVTSPDHSRRVRRTLTRAFDGHRTQVTVRYSHYSEFDPDRWWQTRSGRRIWIIESQKLLLDLVTHPIS